ncbi:dihydroorotate dehydrogenase electron transfer subunit [Rossellomorea vietnamensis]|uniref:Dihydroorotate dehydrogenase B (NAD(+)), electron transfer subunit n=1 Tax=Rossellomorea aquimaris TaxID=189382 RepID=A0A5D4TQS4_9BACI|nr:dihydroorotate dehydrogenase electron transfer subunit [Rossellomorea aquimaris]TYS77181.1 dihydroorotate dehydrogenase electron transfer subunit [Rossellomorea aquimaris]
MIKKDLMKILSNEEIAENIFKMVVSGDLVSQLNDPGQFLHFKTGTGAEPLLRRPISIAEIDKENNSLTVIYRTEGRGTKLLSAESTGSFADVLGPLGNGFPIHEEDEGKTALLVGGGIGVPPLYELSKQLVKRDFKVLHVLGFQNRNAAFYEEEFARLGPTYIATVDGSLGTKGFVTDVIKEEGLQFDLFYSCGPKAMLAALSSTYGDSKGYISLEERMGCGIGACFACVCEKAVNDGDKNYVKICSDGPVFPVGMVKL